MDAVEETLALVRVRAWLRSGRAREIRRRAGLSQADVARAIGTDAPQVSRWEAGKAVPYRDSALKLARLYDGLEDIARDEMTAVTDTGHGLQRMRLPSAPRGVLSGFSARVRQRTRPRVRSLS